MADVCVGDPFVVDAPFGDPDHMAIGSHIEHAHVLHECVKMSPRTAAVEGFVVACGQPLLLRVARGVGSANRFSCDPRHGEHHNQLGGH